MPKLRELKRGDFFTRKPIEKPRENQVFVRGDYDNSVKAFECYRFSDVNDTIYIHGSKEVYIDFTF